MLRRKIKKKATSTIAFFLVTIPGLSPSGNCGPSELPSFAQTMAKETKVKVLSKSGRTQITLVSLLDCHCHSVLLSPRPHLSGNFSMYMPTNGGGIIQRPHTPYPDTELPLLTCSNGKCHMPLLALGSVLVKPVETVSGKFQQRHLSPLPRGWAPM